MKLLIIAMMSTLLSVAAASAEAPPLDYVAVPDDFKLPAGMTFGSTSGVAVNSKGNILVLSRGPHPLMEFDGTGQYIRSLGQGLYDRPHGLRIDRDDNIWTTDVASHVVYKMNPDGRILLVLGVRGNAGDMHPYGHLPLFNEPNDLAFAANGDFFVTQGHGRGEPRVLKFDRDGNFIKAWGKKGKGPGEFDIAHSIAIDAKGLVYVADRNNQRIQVFDADGKHVREFASSGHAVRARNQLRPAPVAGARTRRPGDQARSRRQGAGRRRQAGQGARPVRRGAFHRGRRKRRRLRCRHAELARAEIREKGALIGRAAQHLELA